VARRACRHPGTGHEVALLVEREVLADDEAGEPNGWVDLADTPGGPSWMAKLWCSALCGARGQARRDFAKWHRALRDGGYERVG
jgi:hypothetical protein